MSGNKYIYFNGVPHEHVVIKPRLRDVMFRPSLKDEMRPTLPALRSNYDQGSLQADQMLGDFCYTLDHNLTADSVGNLMLGNSKYMGFGTTRKHLAALKAGLQESLRTVKPAAYYPDKATAQYDPEPRSYYIEKALVLTDALDALAAAMQEAGQQDLPTKEQVAHIQACYTHVKQVAGYDKKVVAEAERKRDIQASMFEGSCMIREMCEAKCDAAHKGKFIEHYAAVSAGTSIKGQSHHLLTSAAFFGAMDGISIYLQTANALLRFNERPVQVPQPPQGGKAQQPAKKPAAVVAPAPAQAAVPVTPKAAKISFYSHERRQEILTGATALIVAAGNKDSHLRGAKLLAMPQEPLPSLREYYHTPVGEDVPPSEKTVASSIDTYAASIAEIAAQIDANSPWQKELGNQIFGDESARRAGEILFPPFSESGSGDLYLDTDGKPTKPISESHASTLGRQGFANTNLKKMRDTFKASSSDAFECVKLIAANAQQLRAAIDTGTLKDALPKIKGLPEIIARHPNYEAALQLLTQEQLTQNLALVDCLKENPLPLIAGVGSKDEMAIAAGRVMGKLANNLPTDNNSFLAISHGMFATQQRAVG